MMQLMRFNFEKIITENIQKDTFPLVSKNILHFILDNI